MDNSVTVVGNVTRDPDFRYTNGGSAVCTLSVAVNRRWQNRQSGEWDESVSFFDLRLWGSLAENAAGSLKKGSRVIATGRIEQQTWETAEGERRSRIVIVADDIGPSLRWATAEITRTVRESDDQPARSSRPASSAPIVEEPEDGRHAPARSGGRPARPTSARKPAPEPELDDDPYDEVPF